LSDESAAAESLHGDVHVNFLLLWVNIRKALDRRSQSNDLGSSKGDGLSGKESLWLELWRGMLEVNNYICLVPSKREVLRRVVMELEDFHNSTTEGGHRSCLLIAPPGAGKTLLASALAWHVKLDYLEFNITQMLSKADILDCFDKIVTTQLSSHGGNCSYSSMRSMPNWNPKDVYSAFLSPLETGRYVRAERHSESLIVHGYLPARVRPSTTPTIAVPTSPATLSPV